MSQPHVHPTFVLKRAYLAMRRAMDEDLQPFGLTSAHFDVLQQLFQADGVEHRVLQERLGITSPTLTNILDIMEAHGYIQRQVSEEDARVKRIFMTPSAKCLHESEAMQHAGECFIQRMFQGFSRSEQSLCLEWLDRIADNLSNE